MRRITPTDSENTRVLINGHAQRLCDSWINSFIEHTDNIETPEIWRRWTAIIAVAAVMEQKCFMLTSTYLYPNLYAIIVGPPGVGKSRTIRVARNLLRPLSGAETSTLHLAPDSMTGASLTDALVEAKRVITTSWDGEGGQSFNSMVLMPDELSDFMKVYDEALIGKLTKFYDVDPYIETRVVGKIQRVIENSQLNMIAGSTTGHLLQKIPEWAWSQGFFSRTILIFGLERELNEDIFTEELRGSEHLAHDIKCIFTLHGQFRLDAEFREAVNAWRKQGELPRPTHPRFEHYCTRRLAHLLKLSMVSSADRNDSLRVELQDYHRARAWLEEAEREMPRVFGHATSVDSTVLAEALHFIGDKEVSDKRLRRFLGDKIPAHSVSSIVDQLEKSGMVDVTKRDKLSGMAYYRRTKD